MHAKSSHNTQTALGFWKDIGHLKREIDDIVGDGGSSQFIVTSCLTDRCVLLNWFIRRYCMWYPRTVPVSVYTTVNKPIQQHKTVRYNGWLRWTAMNLRLQKTVTHFYSSDVRRTLISKVQFMSCGCFLRAFSWVCWRPLRIRKTHRRARKV